MMATTSKVRRNRLRWLGVALLLPAVPACGLSDYEAEMLKAQEREARFREEKKYLGEPLQMPTERDKEGRDVKVAEVFLLPPKGIQTTPKSVQRNKLLWQYEARSQGNEFAMVELAFGGDDKDFAKKVLDSYQVAEGFQPIEYDPSLPFKSWEFNDAQYGYSVNVTQNGQTQIAIVYLFARARSDSARKAITLSLQSFAVGSQLLPAQQRYNQKTPWRLQNKTVP